MTSPRIRTRSRLSSLARAAHAVARRLCRGFAPSVAAAAPRFAPESLEPRQFLSVQATLAVGDSAPEAQDFTLHLNDIEAPAGHLVTPWTINWGDGTSTELPFGGTSASATHQYSDDGTYAVTATVEDLGDAEPNNPQAFNATAHITDVAATFDIGTDSEVDEGTSIGLYVGNYQDVPADAPSAWTIDWGDGAVSTEYGGYGPFGHYYADGYNNYTIAVTAHAPGGHDVTRETQITVRDVDPYINVWAVNPNVPETSAAELTYSFYDPGDDPLTGWTVLWGDGTSDELLTHTYNRGGTQYEAYATPFVDGTYGPYAVTFNVTRVPPVLSLSGPGSMPEGQTVRVDANYVPTGDHTADSWWINWGDGTSTEALYNTNNSAGFEHVYAGHGDYTITVTASDDSASATQSHAVTVTDIPAQAHASGVDETDEGASYTLHASASDVVDNPILRWEIDWGDGKTETVSAWSYTYSPGTGGHIDDNAIPHVFPNGEADHAITVTAVLQDGTRATDQKDVHVRDVPATFDVSLNVQGTVHDGSWAYATLSVSNYHDVPADPFQNWSVDWGDGNVTAGFSSSQTAVREFCMAGHYPALVTTNGGGREVVGVDIRPGFDLHSSDDQVLTDTPSATLSFGNYEGPGTFLSWSVDWGDKSDIETYPGPSQQVSHSYPPGSFTAKVSARAQIPNDSGTHTYAVAYTRITAGPPALDELSVIDNAQPRNRAVADGSTTPAHLYVLERDGSAAIKLGATFSPSNRGFAGQLLWKVTGSGASPSNGTFASDAQITLSSGNRQYTISAGPDLDRNGTLSSDEISRTSQVTVVKVQLESDPHVFLNSRYSTTVHVEPSDAASHVKLMMGDPSLALFSGGASIVAAPGDGQAVVVGGRNMFYDDGTTGGTSPIYAAIIPTGTELDALEPTAAKVKVGKTIIGKFTDLVKSAFKYVDTNGGPFIKQQLATQLKNGVQKKIDDDLKRLIDSGDPGNLAIVRDFNQAYDQVLKKLVADAATRVANDIVATITHSNPSGTPEILRTLDVSRILPQVDVEGYNSPVAFQLSDENALTLGFAVKLQPVSEILSRMNQIGQLPQNPQWLFEEMGVGIGMKTDNKHAFSLAVSAVYDQNEPKLLSPDVRVDLKYDFIDSRGFSGSISGFVRSRFQDRDPNGQVVGVQAGLDLP